MLKRLSLATLAACAALTLAACASAPTSADAPRPTARAADMAPAETIARIVELSADHATLNAALHAAGLYEPLTNPFPYTLFAPVDSAFAALPPGALGALLRPDNKTALARVLTYHLVPERIDSAELAARIKAGGGTTSLRTASSGTLFFTMAQGRIFVTDETGASAAVTVADEQASNGVIHVVDKVLIQKSPPGRTLQLNDGNDAPPRLDGRAINARPPKAPRN